MKTVTVSFLLLATVLAYAEPAVESNQEQNFGQADLEQSVTTLENSVIKVLQETLAISDARADFMKLMQQRIPFYGEAYESAEKQMLLEKSGKGLVDRVKEMKNTLGVMGDGLLATTGQIQTRLLALATKVGNKRVIDRLKNMGGGLIEKVGSLEWAMVRLGVVPAPNPKLSHEVRTQSLQKLLALVLRQSNLIPKNTTEHFKAKMTDLEKKLKDVRGAQGEEGVKKALVFAEAATALKPQLEAIEEKLAITPPKDASAFERGQAILGLYNGESELPVSNQLTWMRKVLQSPKTRMAIETGLQTMSPKRGVGKAALAKSGMGTTKKAPPVPAKELKAGAAPEKGIPVRLGTDYYVWDGSVWKKIPEPKPISVGDRKTGKSTTSAGEPKTN